MDLNEINRLTIKAYNKTARKYHECFKNEILEKEYDRLILDRYSEMIKEEGLICDAGCGPSGQIGKYLNDKGHKIIGIDIAPACINIAKNYSPEQDFKVMDMMNTDFEDEEFDGIISYYSIIYTPKEEVEKLLTEFYRILKKNGKLLIVVKKGESEGIIDDDWYEGNKVYFTNFIEEEIRRYMKQSSFQIEYFDTRKPYNFEFNVERIYSIGSKV